MEWQIAEDEDKKNFIKRVRRARCAAIFEAAFMRLQYIPVSFYKSGHLFLLQNLKSDPPFNLDYILAGEHLVYMDGSDRPFKHLNKKGLLNLNSENVVDYLRSYLSFVIQPHVKIYLLQDANFLPFKDSFFIDFNFDKNNYTDADIKISRNDYDNGYIITAPFVFGGKIDPGIAHISDDGDVAVKKEAGR